MNRNIFFIYILFAAALSLGSCKNGNDQQQQAQKPAETPAKDSAATDAFTSSPAEETTVPEESASVEDRVRLERMAHYRKMYSEALKAQDPYMQLEATFNLLVDDTAKSRPYIDTLASLYARLGMAESALKMANRVLAADPGNKLALEIKAGGSVGMGKSEEAVDVNRKLYRQTKDVKYLFAVAELQFDKQDTKGLDNTLKQIEQHPNLSKQKIEMQTDVPGKVQMIPADATLEYLKGLISLSKNELAMAEIHLHKATQISPNFVLANRYLQALAQQQQQQH